MAGRSTALAVLGAFACLLPLGDAEFLGELAGPFTGAGIKYIESEVDTPNYRRVKAYIKGVATCSGVVTRLSLIRDLPSDAVHEISLIFHSYENAVCAQVATLTGTGASQAISNVEFRECVNPAADAVNDLTEATVEWYVDGTSVFTTWRINGVDIASSTKVLTDSSDPYRLNHKLYFVTHHSTFPGFDGIPTTTCEQSNVLVDRFEITPYSTRFSDTDTFTLSMKADSYANWGGSGNWEVLSSFFLQHPQELLLHNNLQVTTDGVLLFQGLLNPYYDPNGVLATKIGELNGFFQGASSGQSFTDPAPWVPSTSPESVASWWYDPFDTVARGMIEFFITSTGVSKRSIRLAQGFKNFFFDPSVVGNQAMGDSEIITHEYCVFLRANSTHTRKIELALYAAGGSADDTLKQKFFGVWNVTLRDTGAYEQYARCFSVNSDQSGVTDLELEILLGAVDGIIFKEHTIRLESVRFYRVKGDAASTAASDGWARGQELMKDANFDEIAKWTPTFDSTKAQVKSGSRFEWDLFGHTDHPANLSLSQTDKVAIQKAVAYRMVFRGNVEANSIASPTDPANINGRVVQFFVTNADGARVFGGTGMARLVTSLRTFQLTFLSDETAMVPNSADGTAIVTIWSGGRDFGSSGLNPLFTGINLVAWTDLTTPTFSALPAEPDLTPRTPDFTTPVPPTPTSTPRPPPVTPVPTPVPTTVQIPDMFTVEKTLPGLQGVIYKSKFYKLDFINVAVESIAVDTFRANLSTTMNEVCLFMGFAVRLCAFTTDNVVVLEVCYRNLPRDIHASDPRACRGLGNVVTYPTAVNATGVGSYMIFTFAGVPASVLQDGEYEPRVIETLNTNIAKGQIGIRPQGSAIVVKAIVATPSPFSGGTESDHGLSNAAWMAIIVVCALLGLGLGFNAWYQHSIRHLKRSEAQKELFKRDLAPEYVPTIVNGLGMLQLEQLGLLKQQFDAMDADDGGTLDKKEIRDVLQLLKVNVTEDEFVRFFNNIDEDGNEEIEFTEFAVGFIPFLVGQVRACGGDVNFDTEAEKIFSALSGEQRLSSIFEDREMDLAASEQLIKKTQFLERSAASVVKSMAKRRNKRKGPGNAPDDSVLIQPLEAGDRIEVTDDAALYDEVMQHMPALIPDEEQLPVSFDEVAGAHGIILKVDRSHTRKIFQVDLPNIDRVYWLEPAAVLPRRVPAVEQYLGTEKRNKARKYERNMVIRAVVAGLISSALTAGAEMLAEKYFTDDDENDQKGFFSTSIGAGKKPMYWVVLILATVVFAVCEILYLYYDALHTSMKVSDIFGLVLYPMDEERKFYCNALARSSLELGNPVHRMFSINPMREKSEVGKFLSELAYKAKSGVSTFLLRVSFKRLLTRVGAKAAQAYVACPVVMIANGLVARLVLDKSRVVALGPRLILRMLEHPGEGEPPPWHLGSVWVTVEHFEKLRVNILRAIGCVVVARGEWHPNLENLYKTTRRKLGWNNERKQMKKKQAVDLADSSGDTAAAADGETPALEEGEVRNEEEEIWDELNLMKMMRMDTLVTYNMDVVEKLTQALRLDAHADMLRADQLYETDSTVSDEDYDVLSSEDSSRYDASHQIAFDQNEKCIILKFLVLAILVSGKPTRGCLHLASRCFQAAGGDITARPGKTIKSLYRLFYQGHIQSVCKNFDLIFKAHRTMRGDQHSFSSRMLAIMVDSVDW